MSRHLEGSVPLFGTGDLNLQDSPSGAAGGPKGTTKNDDDDGDGTTTINSKNNTGNNKKEKGTAKKMNPFAHLRNAFHATTALYGSTDDGNSQHPRVGQNLLLRPILDDDDDNDGNDDEVGVKTNKQQQKKKKKKTTTAVTDTDNDCDDDDDDDENGILTIIDENNANEATALFGTVGGGETNKKSKKNKKKQQQQQVHHPDLYKPHLPQHHPVLYCFNVLQGVTIMNSLSLIVGQLLPCFMIRPFSAMVSKIGVLSLLLKGYIGIFNLLFILMESDFTKAILPINTGFISRGFLYSFVGLICVQQAYDDIMKEIIAKRGGGLGGGTATSVITSANLADTTVSTAIALDWVSIYLQITSWFMVSIGALYIVLGLCCLKGYRDRLKQQESTAWRDYRIHYRQWKELHVNNKD